MQTFLPYPNFRDSAECLDNRRLAKQRVEVLQILRCLIEKKKAWGNHPAVRMWRGHEGALADYGMCICLEWRRRGGADNVFDQIDKLVEDGFSIQLPSWLGRPDFHASHRSNLLKKQPTWYRRFGWSEPDDLPYVWPV